MFSLAGHAVALLLLAGRCLLALHLKPTGPLFCPIPVPGPYAFRELFVLIGVFLGRQRCRVLYGCSNGTLSSHAGPPGQLFFPILAPGRHAFQVICSYWCSIFQDTLLRSCCLLEDAFLRFVWNRLGHYFSILVPGRGACQEIFVLIVVSSCRQRVCVLDGASIGICGTTWILPDNYFFLNLALERCAL